jgi:hypothetical protein
MARDSEGEIVLIIRRRLPREAIERIEPDRGIDGRGRQRARLGQPYPRIGPKRAVAQIGRASCRERVS